MRFLILILLVSALNACYPKLYSNPKNPKEKKTLSKQSISINSKNLSEDVNIMSTQNDELIFLVYSKLNREFPENILQEEFVMDSINTPKTFKLSQKLKSEEEIILVLLEMDTKQSLKQIEPIVRINIKTILEAFIEEDNMLLKEFLGDDDILYITRISYKKFNEKALNIQGINLFDAYDYTFTLTETK